jgi:catalase
MTDSLQDLLHAVKAEPSSGFPTGGSAHTTAYDFFNQHPEGAMQLMTVLSDLGIPRDARHISGNGVHTFRFINAQGESQLFKWFWIPMLGHRSLVYDEATTLAGKNNDFFKVDLYQNIAAGNFPEWEFGVQIFPDDGTFMYNDYDLLIPTQIVPFEEVPLTRLGKLTLNRNINNFFAETESISFAPSNVVNGVSFVPDPLLQWRLMSYDDTSTHRHNSPNGYLLPINRAIAPINNNYRDGYMQPLIELADSISTPNTIGGVVAAGVDQTFAYTPASGESAGSGPIGRYKSFFDWFGQARTFWSTMDPYAKQHTVDAYRFELGNVANMSVAQAYIDQTLNSIDNCLARRVAYGIGATLPALGSGPSTNTTFQNAQFPSMFPLNPGMEPNKSLAGLAIAVVANDTLLSLEDYETLNSAFGAENVTLTVVAPRMGMLETGVNATASYITASSVFYDAVLIGSPESGNSTGSSSLDAMSMAFVKQAYSHGKAIGALGNGGIGVLDGLGFPTNSSMGVYSGATGQVATSVMEALMGPVRFFARFPIDDLDVICS